MDATPYITNRVIINSELMKKIKKTTVGEAILDISLYTILILSARQKSGCL